MFGGFLMYYETWPQLQHGIVGRLAAQNGIVLENHAASTTPS